MTLKDAREIDPNAQVGDQIEVFTKPEGTTKFLLGTDHLGRDVFSRVVYGARISLIVSLITLAVGGSIGVVMGLAAGWYAGFIDEFLMRLVDIKLAIPLILIALVLVITLGQSLWIIVTVLCLFIWPRFARQVRGEVLQLKHMDYVSLGPKGFWCVYCPNFVYTHIPRDDQYIDSGSDSPSRNRDSFRVNSKFLRSRCTASYASLGINGFRRSG
ncbi:MAG: hypothetical protein Ct9H300mP11_31690 [Chloroflexota bacterium]|nr:MAG: hypothetical protein Ct9H300mP11_31690 [Chloroflexota bacterium]